jgi:hypothetical protein
MTIVTRTPQWTGAKLWLRWSAASTVAIIIGFVLAVVAIVVTGEEERTDPYFMIVFPLILAGVGALLGIAQSWILRRAIGAVPGWTLCSAVGIGLGLAVALALPEGSGLPGVVIAGAAHGVAIGAIVGTLEWLALARRLSGARWWVVTSIVAWSVGAAIGDFMGHYAEPPIDLMTGFVVAAVVSGAGLTILVRRSSCPPNPGAGG